jgi:hypothetical protein
VRYHRTFAQFDLWRDPGRLRAVVDPATLVAARLEPISYSLSGKAGLDLTFARDGEIAVVPLIIVDAAMLAESEASPFLWPASSFEGLEICVTDSIEDRVLPWILSLCLGRQLNREVVRVYADGADAQTFAAAAEYGFLGAASYERVAAAMAPYALALRSSHGRRCLAVDRPDGASGVALLRRNAVAVFADLGSEGADALAARWFGIDAFERPIGNVTFDVAIARGAERASGIARRFIIDGNDKHGNVVPIVRPIPLDLMMSFETDDAPACGCVAVTLPPSPLREPYGGARPAAVGGSAGRILFVLREDFSRLEDSDTDEALALADALRAEGFAVDLAQASAQIGPGNYDLVHLFSLPAVAQLERLADATRGAGVTLVVTANLPDIAAQGVWGSGITLAVERMSLDEAMSEERLNLVATRKLNAQGMLLGSEPHIGYHDRLARVLKLCDGAIVHCAAEGRLLRERFGFGGELAVLAPLALTDAPAAEVDSLVGDGEFVLTHLPIGPHSNLLALTRAANAAGLPLVLAGQVADIEYLCALRRWSGDRTAVLTAASNGQIAALYRRARVYADVAWIPGGLARPARAALSGCRLVLSEASYGYELWGNAAAAVDPASAQSIAAGLTAAWNAAADSRATAALAGGIVAACDPARTLSAAVNLYAAAARRRTNA